GAIINSTGNETGVIVNGIPATVYGSQFIVNNVSLTEGSNTITVIATDTAGNTASSSITVNAVTTGSYINITANPESGISPLEVTLKIDGSFSIASSTITYTGPAQPETLSSSADEHKIKLTAEGIYYFTANSTGPDSNTYQDTVAVVVLNKNQLDNLLKAKWNAMKTALVNKDVNGALNYYTEESKQLYNDTFTALYSNLPQITQNMQDIQLVYSEGTMAKYRIRRNEVYAGQAIDITYYIYFVVDDKDIWKIHKF
ncbi:MAG: adhesin, partial [Nitrospirae bacterium]|nr:adhesin [Nitrospirota bacterium]